MHSISPVKVYLFCQNCEHIVLTNQLMKELHPELNLGKITMKSNLSQHEESSILLVVESHEDAHKSTSAKAFIKNAFY